MSWTDHRKAEALRMWDEGKSASQIAKHLGGVSRNAVIGIVHRSGKSNRAKAAVPKRIVYKAPAVPRAPYQNNGLAFRTKSQPEPLVFGAGHDPGIKPPTPVGHIEEAPGAATIHTLGAHACKWPIGDPMLSGFTFCGRRRDGGRSYCAEHCDVAYQPLDKKQNSPAALARSLRRYV